MNKKGGYIIIDLQSATIVNDLAKALDSNKPVLVYNDGVANFYTLSYDSVSEVYTLTGAKEIISVDGDGDITQFDEPLLEKIRDKDGNLRFIDIDANVNTISGVNITYAKASLSGTHLLFVLAGNVDDATTLTDAEYCNFDLPKYISDKIVTTYLDIVESQSVTFTASDYSVQSSVCKLTKNNDIISIKSSLNAFTFTADRYFRVQFDLLIDNE